MTYATVRAATSPELTYLRSTGQWSRLFLAIFKPNVIYTAMAVHPGATDRIVQVGFTDGSGTLANVKKDMTMYVGSTAGAYDLGIARIRKAPIAGTFYIGEESDIGWQITSYITIVDEFDLWARHINTVSDTLFYMDYDIAYTDQNVNHDPVPIMGGHRVLKLTGASVTAIFDFSNSHVIGSTITGYSTTSPDASSSTGLTTATPTLTFNTTGWHTFYLTVTAANGKTYTGVRYVYVYSASAMPATVFQLGECSEDYETGGWTFSVTMQDEIGLSNVPDRTMCILFAEDFYGDAQVSIGQLAGCENIIAIGKIAEEGISINPEQSEVTLRIQGYQYWLNQVYAFPTGLIQVTTTPTNWAEIQSPTVDKVAFHLLHWASTATTIMDCYLPGDTRLAKELISPASNLWAQLQELCFASIQARVGVDPYSRLFVEVEPQLVPVASRTWATVMTITKPDWYDTVNMQRVVITPTGMVSASGVYVDSSGNGNAQFMLSPGHVFKHYGGTEIVDRLLLSSSQSVSNQLTALILGWKNNQYPNNEFKLVSNNRMIDCFPRQKIAWSVASGDSPRALTLTANFIPRRVERSWDPATGFLETSITLEMESIENLSTVGDTPGSGDVDLSVPPEAPDFPPLPDFPIIIPGDIPPTIVTMPVIIHSTTYGLIHTPDILIASPVWTTINAGLTATQYSTLNRFFVTPNGALYAGRLSSGDTGDFVARAPSVGGTFVIIEDATSILAKEGGTLNRCDAIGYNPLVSEQVAYILQGTNGGGHAYLGAAGSYPQVYTFTNIGQNGPIGSDYHQHQYRLSYGFGNWIFHMWSSANGNQLIVKFNAGFTAVVTTVDIGGIGSHNVCHRAGATGKFFLKPTTAGLKTFDNNDASILTIVSIDSDIKNEGMNIDLTGMAVMTRYATGNRGKSSDGGATWSFIPGLSASNNYHFAPAGGVNDWVAAGGGNYVELTIDFGTNWTPKTGNLATIMATGPSTINMVRVLNLTGLGSV